MQRTAPTAPRRAPIGRAQVPHSASGFRPDVQGLRALAVLLVLGFHLYPRLVPGGYIGVDVFFVISGFLITDHLARRLTTTGRIGLLEFYGRRARRLLPAAVTVLLATAAGSVLLLPATQVPEALRQIRASALYFENWLLASSSVDYMQSDAAPSPVQHYWSLSIEEQFYLIWPLLFVVGAIVARRVLRRTVDRAAAARPVMDTEADTAAARARGLRLATAGAVLVVAVSLVASVYLTHTHRAAAYFVTVTRLWELGAGGLLALVYPRIAPLIGRFGALAWAGLAMVTAAAFTFDGDTAFPGVAALLPVVGTLLLITCGSAGATGGTAAVFTRRAAVVLGDLSYALYLWHWPLIVLYLAWAGGSIGSLDGPVIALASVALAWLTKIWVEDPLRHAPWIAPYPGRSLATAFGSLVPVGAVTGLLFVGPVANINAEIAAARPDVTVAPKDLPLANTGSCKARADDTDVITCARGETDDPELTIALVGDSFAGQWSSVLAEIGADEGWRIVTVTHDACPWTAQMTERDGQPFTACHTWGVNVLDYLTGTLRPDVVLATFRPLLGTPDHPDYGAQSQRQIAEGMAEYFRALADAGTYVVGINPTPRPGKNIPDCLSGRDATVAGCTVARADAEHPTTAIGDAVALVGPGHARLIDLNDNICTATACPPIRDNVIVYRDSQHLTKSFSLALEPELTRSLESVPALRG